MKKTIIVPAVLLLLFSNLLLAQNSFTQEWESPAGLYTLSIIQSERNNSIPDIVMRDGAYNIKVFDGATKQLKYTYADPDSLSFNYNQYFYRDWTNIPIDVNNDNKNELIVTSYSEPFKVRVYDGASGSILFQNSYSGYYGFETTMDIDGDGYIEILLSMYTYTPSYSSKYVIISTTSNAIGIQNNTEQASDFKLKQNYPNPFNPTTTIEYSISRSSDVQVNFYDELGQLVKTFDEGKKTAGMYKLNFEGSGLASGVYFYQLVVDNYADTKKMVLVK